MAKLILERDEWGKKTKADRPKVCEDASPLRKYMTTEVIEKGVNPDTGMQLFTFIASTEAVDREGDILFADGWETENYLANPVILWGHNYSSKPIGRAVALEVKNNKLYVTVDFTPASINPEGYQIYLMVQAGYVSAVSVGFQPKKWVWNEEHNGYDFQSNELLEVSVVPVPANQEALLAAGIEPGFAKAFSEMSTGAAASLVLKDIINAAMTYNKSTTDTVIGGETHTVETTPQTLFVSNATDSGDGTGIKITDSGGNTWTGTGWTDSDHTVPYAGGDYREMIMPENWVWPPPQEQKGLDDMELEKLLTAIGELVKAVTEQNEKLASLPDELAQRLAPEGEEKIEEPKDTKEPEAEAEAPVPEGDESDDDVIEIEGLTEDGLREMLGGVVKDATTATTGRLPD